MQNPHSRPHNPVRGMATPMHSPPSLPRQDLPDPDGSPEPEPEPERDQVPPPPDPLKGPPQVRIRIRGSLPTDEEEWL